MSERNWSGNVEFAAAGVHRPHSVDELQSVIASASAAGRRVHATGSSHSFSTVADTTGQLIVTRGLDRIVKLDPDAHTVTVEAGIRYGELSAALHAAGWALHNLPSLPHITVGGAVATATHGSGISNGNLATAVVALDLVTADGSIECIDAHDSRFDGAVVNLGALGVVARLTLAIEPTYDVAQVVYRNVPDDAVLDDLDAVMGSAYSVSLFTDYQANVFEQLWWKGRVGLDGEPPTEVLGARPAKVPLHPVPAISAESCTPQLGVVGAWCDRLPHFRLGFEPSSGDELQSEYFVARSDGANAVRAVRSLASELSPLIKVSEIRTVAADDQWLSGSHHRDTLALHFTWVPDQPRVLAMLPALESALAEFGARPHWGKLTAMAPATVRSRYPRWDDWATLTTQLDPTGIFRNDYVAALVT